MISLLKSYLKIYFEAWFNYMVAPVSAWVSYHLVIFLAWTVDIDLSYIEMIAKVVGVIVGLISSIYVIRHVSAQTMNVRIDNEKKKEEIKKLKLENARAETELDNERQIAEFALNKMKKEEGENENNK